jgi:hypothetical protein
MLRFCQRRRLSGDVEAAAAAGAKPPRRTALEHMQRTAGNQATLRMLSAMDSAGRGGATAIRDEKTGPPLDAGAGSAAPVQPTTEPVKPGAGAPSTGNSPAPKQTNDPQPAKPPDKTAPPPKPQTARIPQDIRGNSTPREMKSNRIPPRAETEVQITLSGTPDPQAPVTLKVTGQSKENGTVSIDGQAQLDLTRTGALTVKLQGADQTAPKHAGQLKLVAEQHGKALATSRGFSVAAIPENYFVSKNKEIANASYIGVDEIDQWRSDSDGTFDRKDLTEVAIAERVQRTVEGKIGRFSLSSSCYKSSDPRAKVIDSHELPTAIILGEGKITTQQTHMFSDNRTGETNIPMTASGYTIEHLVQQDPKSSDPKDLVVITAKVGAETTAKDPNPSCKSGPIHSTAGEGSVKTGGQPFRLP